MSVTGNLDTELMAGAPVESRTQWQLFRRRFFRHKLALLGLLLLAVMVFLSFGVHFLSPYKNEADLLRLPSGPSAKHWLGVDLAGKDVATAIMYAGQTSLKVGLFTALAATIVGALVGAFAGYRGGWLDQILMRLTDLFLLLPALVVLAIALAKLGQSITGVVVTLAGLGWMSIARIVRGQVLSLKEKEFVEAARSIGGSPTRIIFRHILPNLVGPIMVNASLAVAGAIVAESTLSFLGFGLEDSWGRMLSNGLETIETRPYLIYFPGLAIILVTLAVNFVGDGLRDAFDPQAKH